MGWQNHVKSITKWIPSKIITFFIINSFSISKTEKKIDLKKYIAVHYKDFQL